MRKLLGLLLLFTPAIAAAQDAPFPISPVLSASGRPLPGAQISICSNPAVGSPCTNYASTFSDQARTQSINQATSPIVTDSFGNVPAVFAAPGIYVYTISGAGIGTLGPYFVTISCTPGVSCAATGANNVFTGNNCIQQLSGIQYVGCGTNTTVQAAINALPGTGGVVRIPAGTYVGPTSIPNSNTSLICEDWLGCTFTYSAGVTLGSPTTSLQNIKLDGIVFDFGGGNFGLTLTALKYSTFRIRVQNTASTAAGLTLSGGNNVGAANFWWSSFPYLHIINTGLGLVLNGDNNMPSCGGAQGAGGAVYGNTFDFLFLENLTGTAGLQFTSGADSNHFGRTYVRMAAANNNPAMVFNSRCTTQFGDITLETFDHVEVEVNGGAYSGNFLVLNNSQGRINSLIGGVGSTNNNMVSSLGPAVSIWSIGYINQNPDGLNAASLRTNGLLSTSTTHNSLQTPATAGANFQAPAYCWDSSEWNGSAPVTSSWCFTPQIAGSGVPSSDIFALTNTGSAAPTANQGFSIPTRLIINTPGGGNSVVVSQTSTPNVQFFLPAGSVSGTVLTQTIASGTATMTTAAIAAGACGTTVTVSALNVTTSDRITISSSNAAVTTPNGLLTLNYWPTAGNVNFNYCNPTASIQTPTANTVPWGVTR